MYGMNKKVYNKPHSKATKSQKYNKQTQTTQNLPAETYRTT